MPRFMFALIVFLQVIVVDVPEVPSTHLGYAADAAAIHQHEPALLIAIASIESNFKPRVVSRARGGRYCGVMQVKAKTQRECDALRADVALAYREGALRLREWLRMSRGNLSSALRGFGCGFVVGSDGKVIKPARIPKRCNNFDRRVLAALDQYRQKLTFPTRNEIVFVGN